MEVVRGFGLNHRENNPKQFASLFGGKSLFEITLERARKLVKPSHIFVGTSQKYTSLIKTIASEIPAENIIAEPMRRDTAMAHGLGALFIINQDPDAIIVNMASDHLITPMDVFSEQMLHAAELAYKYDYLVTVGIKPRFPHSGMGHIKASEKFENQPNALLGEKFIEKPALDVAREYTESGNYYWNANLYVFKARLYLDLLEKYSPKTCTMYSEILKHIGTDREREVIQSAFQMAPSISIDYAVAEKLHKFICVPSKFHWTDVGDWKEVYNNLQKDEAGNVIEGPHGRGEYIGINSKNNLLFLDKKVIATVGLEDMLIIDTPDALLICPKDEAQGVKQVVQALKESGLTDYL